MCVNDCKSGCLDSIGMGVSITCEGRFMWIGSFFKLDIYADIIAKCIEVALRLADLSSSY